MNLLPTRVLDLLVPQYPVLEAAERERILSDTAALLWSMVCRSPTHVRVGVVAMGLAFRIWMAIAQIPLKGPGAVKGWEAVTGGPGRAFVRLVRSLAALSFLEHPLVLPYLGLPLVPDQQQRFRQIRRRLIEWNVP